VVLERIATTPTATDGGEVGGHLNESAFVAVFGVVSVCLENASDRSGHRVDDCGEAAGRTRDDAEQHRMERVTVREVRLAFPFNDFEYSLPLF